MAISQKYGRTYHYPFSPGTSSDDRIQFNYWEHLAKIPAMVHTEKLDGENNCLSRFGVFARSHAAPTTSPWTESIRRFWQSIKQDLGSMTKLGGNKVLCRFIRLARCSGDSCHCMTGSRGAGKDPGKTNQ